MSTINVHIFVSFNCIPSIAAYLNSPMFIPLTASHDCTQCPHPMSISDAHIQCMDLMLVLLPTLLSEPNQCSDPMLTSNDVPATKCPHPMPAPNTLTQCLHPVPTLSAALFPTPCSHLMLTPKVHYLASIQHQLDFFHSRI